jgi:hypothetical protein
MSRLRQRLAAPTERFRELSTHVGGGRGSIRPDTDWHTQASMSLMAATMVIKLKVSVDGARKECQSRQ